MKIARPLPLEYLIIDVPTGFPSADAQIQSTFNDDCKAIKTPFCVENRMQIGELQVKIKFSFDYEKQNLFFFENRI
jgi:hypothetical protein